MLEFYVAGVQFHNLKNIIDDVEEGDEIDLIQESENKFDPNAVRLEIAGTHIGYVPKKLSAEVAAAIEVDSDLHCSIVELNKDAKPWNQCKVCIKTTKEIVGESTEEPEHSSDEYYGGE